MKGRARFRTEKGVIAAGKENIRRIVEDAKKEDREWCMEVKTWSGAKTWEQIKTIHGVIIPAISEHTGETRKDVKRRLKLEYGEVEYFTKDNDTYVELKSFSTYTKSEMRKFIDALLLHCEHDLDFIIDLETRNILEVK